jgi:mono/diheme cytochrome c family protein
MTEPHEPPTADAPRQQVLKARIIRWSLLGLAGLVGLLIVVTLVLYVRGRSLLGREYDVTPTLTHVPTDEATVARGGHLARTHGCILCHGERLEGRVLDDVAPAFIAAPNLTRGLGGVGARYSALDWDRAVRYGVEPDGRVLLPMMPYDVYNRLNDADMAALAAYLASRPGVDNQVPPSRVKTFGYIMFGVSGLPRDGFDRPRSMITPGATPEYGSYLASTLCAGCHGDTMQGARGHFPAPGLVGYGAAEPALLVRSLREGVAADGRALDNATMPWEAFRHMTDMEITALHMYLRTLAAR